ncbi:GFA family protein [Pseudomonas sp. MWU13-2105]|uniref:GFA family protein n=1 Tax=Pseudomonas sp. MWU13-2105 TaxID=2935074 RepID=UPI002010645F|nr:GFA family protein [Pseudomonas sp. MWU13-2105]
MNLSVFASGSCRCGLVTFELRARPIITTACHCTGCQKMSASAFSLSALVPAGQFVVTLGEPVIGGLHGTTRHYFCPHCLSWLFTRPAGNEVIVGVRSSLLDNPRQFAPFIETWTREKLPWVATGAMHGFEGFPDPQDFTALTQQYAQWRQA